jgi:hypothetical protein
MENRLERTIDILLDAYNSGNLESGKCAKCAVGNIILANFGSVDGSWYYFLHSNFLIKNTEEENILAVKQINSTGYSVEEIIEIETAFEENNSRYGLKAALYATIKTLKKLENNVKDYNKYIENKLKQKVYA